RRFVQSMAGLGMAAAAPPEPPQSDRQYWLQTLPPGAHPLLRNPAAGSLKRNMPVETVTGSVPHRPKYSHPGALGRLLAGISPWLGAPLEASPERDRQQAIAGLARESIRSATDPKSPDYLNFHEGSQPLVDCGFLAQAILRAPVELWQRLDSASQRN